MLVPVPWFETILQVYAHASSELCLVLASLQDVFQLTDKELQWFMGRTDLAVVMHQDEALYLVTPESVCVFFQKRMGDSYDAIVWSTFMERARQCYVQLLQGLLKTINELLAKVKLIN